MKQRYIDKFGGSMTMSELVNNISVAVPFDLAPGEHGTAKGGNSNVDGDKLEDDYIDQLGGKIEGSDDDTDAIEDSNDNCMYCVRHVPISFACLGNEHGMSF